MEIFDIVDAQGVPTGETVERAEAHRLGIRHRTAHVWVARCVNGEWQILLQRRNKEKDSFPGCYDTSSAGHIRAGDEPLDSALRELAEELGIRAAADELIPIGRFDIAYEKEFHGRLFRDREVSFVYVYQKDVDEGSLTLQAEEVQEARWFSVAEVSRALSPRDPRFCVPSAGFALIRAWCEDQARQS